MRVLPATVTTMTKPRYPFPSPGKLARLALLLVTSVIAAVALASCDVGGNPTTPTAPVATGLTRGQAIFRRNCNSCHPGGGRGAGPTLQTIASTWSDDEIKGVVRNGKTRMPGFGAGVINDEELADLVAYVRTLKGP